jgi:hypothetical protein
MLFPSWVGQRRAATARAAFGSLKVERPDQLWQFHPPPCPIDHNIDNIVH